MLHASGAFGTELRRRRMAAGWTIARLAAAVHYSKGQISKIETGRKRPTPELARLCDDALGAGGALHHLVPEEPPRGGRRRPPRPDAGSVTPSRRRVVTLGAASVLGASAVGTQEAAAGPEEAAEPDKGPVLEMAEVAFARFRTLGQVSPPQTVLPPLAEQTRRLQELAAASGPRSARGLLSLAARHAEFAGWMAQESGDDRAARGWTEQAVRLAAAAGDRHLAAYALVRTALMAYYGGDAATTVALARRALGSSSPARIRGLAAQMEAQGHALAGDLGAHERSLDQARELLAAPPGVPGPVLGTTQLTDPAQMAAGWSLVDLGRPRQAARILDEECARVPAHALRTQVRYGIRRALAHALSGEVDHACRVAHPLLATSALTGSATILLDVRRLARTLGRFRARPAVQELTPPLTSALAALAR